MRHLSTLISFLSIQAIASTSLAISLFSYEGVLTNSSGSAITSATPITFQIYFGSCKIYDESQTVTPGSTGEFSVIVGTGTRNDNTGNSMQQLFSSNGSINCDGGSPTTITSATIRYLRVIVNGTTLSPDLQIGNVPFAINAQVADTAKTATGLSPQTDLDFNSKKITNLADPVSAQDAATKAWVQSNFPNISTAGTITGVTSGNGLLGGGNSGSVSLSVDVGTTANKIIQLDATGKLPSVDGSSLTNIQTSVDKIVSASTKYFDYKPNGVACSSGQTLKYSSGSGWICSASVSGTVTSVDLSVPSYMNTSGGPITSSGTLNLGFNSQSPKMVFAAPIASTGAPLFRNLTISDIQSSISGSWLSTSSACPAGQTLTYTSATDNLSCQSYSLTSTQISTALGFTPAPSSAASQWTTAGSVIYFNTGSVGIGTSTPIKLLQVAGDALINGLIVGTGSGSAGGNSAFGVSALANNASGTDNTGIGFASLSQNTSGASNTGLGRESLSKNIAGSQNTAVGLKSLYTATSASFNTALGAQALYATTGGGNTAVGSLSLLNASGSNNTALGLNSGYSLASGTGNIFIGSNSGYSVTSGNYNVILGSSMGSTLAGSNNNIVLSDGSGVERVRINSSGQMGIGTMNPSATLDVSGHIGNSDTGTPTVNCTGNSGSLATRSNDTRGTLNTSATPSGGTNTCTISFYSTYGAAPFCTVSYSGSDGSKAYLVGLGTLTTTTSLMISIVNNSSLSTVSINYFCMQ